MVLPHTCYTAVEPSAGSLYEDGLWHFNLPWRQRHQRPSNQWYQPSWCFKPTRSYF